MLTRTRIRIIGAGLSVALLMAGHSVTAHADATGDALSLAGAVAGNSLDFASALAANTTDPNTTCEPIAAGERINDNVDLGVNGGQTATSANDTAAGVITCFSFTHFNYTLWTKLVIQDQNLTTGAWSDIPGCYDAPGGMQATAGSVTVVLAVPLCSYPVNLGTTGMHIHRARIYFNTNTGLNGKPQPSANVWTLYY
ncbi:MAG TPA: hypothetical protein VN193_12120 [Candidatus Angelobacter sp.]|jgi:hypothetical protein|nr:hypothetical protein [Candidatus Angelobacter sp.]